jgi:hypothetical protein
MRAYAQGSRSYRLSGRSRVGIPSHCSTGRRRRTGCVQLQRKGRNRWRSISRVPRCDCLQLLSELPSFSRAADACAVSMPPSQPPSQHTATRDDACPCLHVVVLAAGVATAMVGHKHDGSYDEHTVIHIIKKGTVSLVPTPEPTAPNTMPWGIGSAAQVCGDQMWFAVPIPAEGLGEGAPQVWYSSWITWQQL